MRPCIATLLVGVNAAKLSGLLHMAPARSAFDFLAAMHQY